MKQPLLALGIRRSGAHSPNPNPNPNAKVDKLREDYQALGVQHDKLKVDYRALQAEQDRDAGSRNAMLETVQHCEEAVRAAVRAAGEEHQATLQALATATSTEQEAAHAATEVCLCNKPPAPLALTVPRPWFSM